MYKEFQMGPGAKSYMRKGISIYEEMRKYFTIYEEAVSHSYNSLHPIPLNFLIYEENFIVFFVSVNSILGLSRILGGGGRGEGEGNKQGHIFSLARTSGTVN